VAVLAVIVNERVGTFLLPAWRGRGVGSAFLVDTPDTLDR
jgi:hypothetical protein